MMSVDSLRYSLSQSIGLAAPDLLERLVSQQLDRLPWPGDGRTLERWQMLAAVAQHDLSLAKLYEGHTDALATLHELDAPLGLFPANATWGVWAAEPPQARVMIEREGGGGDRVRLAGTKAWCSGAASGSHALLTAWYQDGTGPQLVALELATPGVEIDRRAWKAVGMRDSASLDVHLHGAQALLIGHPGDYLRRPGFWHGGAGIAACWYGGAVAIADHLRQAVDRGKADDFRRAAFGQVDVELGVTRALLREVAGWIDTHPALDASAPARRARLAAERCARKVLEATGRTLGAGPFCRDERFAQMAADLPVFIRQSHGDRDFASLADGRNTRGEDQPWAL